MRYGYATSGHKAGQGLNGNIYSGFGTSNIVFRGTKRERKYKKKAAARHSRRKGKGRVFRQTGKRNSTGFCIAHKRVGKEENHISRNP